MLLHESWYSNGGVFIRQKHPFYIIWVYFEQNTIKKNTRFEQNGTGFVQIGILMGGKWGQH